MRFSSQHRGDGVAIVISSSQMQSTGSQTLQCELKAGKATQLGSFSGRGVRTPRGFVPVQLQLVGSHVGYGLGIGCRTREGTVDALVQRGKLVEHAVHDCCSVKEGAKRSRWFEKIQPGLD